MIKKIPDDFKSGYAYAIRLLYRADYTSKMVEDKLIFKGLSKETAKEVTNKLIKDGYIDNLDYGRKFIEDSCNLKAKGAKYIEFELSKRGLSKEEISSLMEKFYNPDIESALMRILKKYGKELSELDLKEASSVKAKLLRMGYSYDEISDCLRNISD